MRVHIPAAYECCQCGAPQGEYVWRNQNRPQQWASMEPKTGGRWLMKKVVILQGGICAVCASAEGKMVAAS